MRQALGLKLPVAEKPLEKPRKQEKPKGINVVLSVRKSSGGTPFRFEHSTNTLSRLEAQLAAEKAARKAGLVVWGLLDIG